MSVERLQVKYRRPRQITGREMWASPEPSDLMVWEVCPYIEGHNGLEDGCEECPEWEDLDGEQVKRVCRAMAEEACRVMMAVQRTEVGGSDAE